MTIYRVRCDISEAIRATVTEIEHQANAGSSTPQY